MRFADYGKRVVFAAFDGGEITSDAGVLLLRERARRIRLFERMAGCFTDHRDRERLIPPSGMPDSRWGFPSGPISDSMW